MKDVFNYFGFHELGQEFYEGLNELEDELWRKLYGKEDKETFVKLSQTIFKEALENTEFIRENFQIVNLKKFWLFLAEDHTFWRELHNAYEPFEPDVFIEKGGELLDLRLFEWQENIIEIDSLKQSELSCEQICEGFDSAEILESILSEYDEKKLNIFENWWIENKKFWLEKLRAATIQHCRFGYNWQFSNKQKQLLKQYYDANLLLVNCLNSDCYVSREVRQEIEETFLLPMEEIERKNTKDKKA